LRPVRFWRKHQDLLPIPAQMRD